MCGNSGGGLKLFDFQKRVENSYFLKLKPAAHDLIGIGGPQAHEDNMDSYDSHSSPGDDQSSPRAGGFTAKGADFHIQLQQ
jgi:hypothetical protein